ncbi:MAG TPA: ATP-binding cassette domain-containing protein [Jatrophihabitans sp.]|jgi:ABC-type lipoprotein export system ATPase subunit
MTVMTTTLSIEASDLFCLYSVPGGATVAALRGMSLRIAAGERVVVHGPNGSGKTTLLRVLTGEISPSAGSVRVGGRELVGASRHAVTALRRDVLGQVDQHSGRTLRPELSVRDNVALQLLLSGRSRPEARRAADAALAALDLDALADRHPATLSAGEAQRVAVCAAIVHSPTVLLADEPTGELDLAAADAVYDLLASAAAHVGATLLLVSHDPRAARVADRVVRIRDGRLSEQWNPQAPDDESLVVDSRGWVRIPEPLRRTAGIGETLRVMPVIEQNRIERLHILGDGHAPPPTPTPPVLPAPAQILAHPALLAEGLRLTFGDRSLYGGLTVEVAPAALTVLRGRSGAGKSTLLRLLLGLVDPDEGRVVLAGVDLTGLDRLARARVRRDAVGVGLQLGSLAEPLDTWENLALARTSRGLAAEGVTLDAAVDALGLRAVADRPVRLLSGGERQRVTIARSLVVTRPVVVLDEPTSQQDEAHAELVTAVLVAAARAGTAVLCATHDDHLAAAADALVELA